MAKRTGHAFERHLGGADIGAGGHPSRRRFIAMSTSAALALITGLTSRGTQAAGVVLTPAHPEPRPGIDGSRVLTPAQLEAFPELVELFDAIRAIPHIVDGIRCYCGCADLTGFYSLLSCYEAPQGMARFCDICEGQGRLAVNRTNEGQSLEQIRRAVDARYGAGAVPATRSADHSKPHT